MKVSICIPLFNASTWVSATLDSIIPQMRDGDEIIIVDDHSTDDSQRITAEILQNSGVEHSIALNPSKGACSARNHALALSRGELIQWLDADDLIGARKISLQREQIANDPRAIAISPFRPFIGDPKTGSVPDTNAWSYPTILSPEDWLASGQMTIPACWLSHRRVFEEAGHWDTGLRINQDGEYFTRVLTCASQVHFIPETEVYYRRGMPGSVSQFTSRKAESLFDSVVSIHRSALIMEDSFRMRQMVSNRYQHAIYTAYPHTPHRIAHARAILKTLPPPNIANPNAVSPLSKVIAKTLGWKSLARLRLLRKTITP